MKKKLTDGPRVLKVCLTIDIEADYARSDRYEILGMTGSFFEWLREEQVPLTAFVVGKLFSRGHRIIDDLQAARVPMAVHGFGHTTETFGTMSSSHEDEIRGGVEAFVKRVGRLPAGYRAPLGVVSREDILLMDSLGLRYDASVFPVRRPGRFNFSALPRSPFRWEGTSLVEMPLGLLTNALPAGMTFINLIGSPFTASLIRRQASLLPAGVGHVVDMHFHNLFHSSASMRGIPLGLKMVYMAGKMRNGFSCLRALVKRLRLAGVVFSDMEADALSLNVKSLPVVGLKCFDSKA